MAVYELDVYWTILEIFHATFTNFQQKLLILILCITDFTFWGLACLLLIHKCWSCLLVPLANLMPPPYHPKAQVGKHGCLPVSLQVWMQLQGYISTMTLRHPWEHLNLDITSTLTSHQSWHHLYPDITSVLTIPPPGNHLNPDITLIFIWCLVFYTLDLSYLDVTDI